VYRVLEATLPSLSHVNQYVLLLLMTLDLLTSKQARLSYVSYTNFSSFLSYRVSYEMFNATHFEFGVVIDTDE